MLINPAVGGAFSPARTDEPVIGAGAPHVAGFVAIAEAAAQVLLVQRGERVTAIDVTVLVGSDLSKEAELLMLRHTMNRWAQLLRAAWMSRMHRLYAAPLYDSS
jgi:hypothetical protein